MKQNTLNRASIDTMGNTEGQRRNVEQKARRLSQRFSKSVDPALMANAGRPGRLDSVGEDTKDGELPWLPYYIVVLFYVTSDEESAVPFHYNAINSFRQLQINGNWLSELGYLYIHVYTIRVEVIHLNFIWNNIKRCWTHMGVIMGGDCNLLYESRDTHLSLWCASEWISEVPGPNI